LASSAAWVSPAILIVSDFVRFASRRAFRAVPAFGLRVHRQLRSAAQSRRSAGLRLALRALSRSEPLGSARHRHRLLPESREEVIAYVKQKYGEASVAQIATFGTMAARAAVRDVGRVLDLPLFRVDEIAKMIPQTLGSLSTKLSRKIRT